MQRFSKKFDRNFFRAFELIKIILLAFFSLPISIYIFIQLIYCDYISLFVLALLISIFDCISLILCIFIKEYLIFFIILLIFTISSLFKFIFSLLFISLDYKNILISFFGNFTSIEENQRNILIFYINNLIFTTYFHLICLFLDFFAKLSTTILNNHILKWLEIINLVLLTFLFVFNLYFTRLNLFIYSFTLLILTFFPYIFLFESVNTRRMVDTILIYSFLLYLLIFLNFYGINGCKDEIQSESVYLLIKRIRSQEYCNNSYGELIINLIECLKNSFIGFSD
ncbi:hypothetical protein TUBRATIS_27360 [Tubulinosema ratisbonensis]|uniref:Uncharacterized protein n=1 Tax=Tubulinosema ratisbonensis TaxID=291195 RepID=A0A437AI80_9MICR|nr:hypothetical protein TUBRATIS_27360 [Tubulinosema ratisbonensis]